MLHGSAHYYDVWVPELSGPIPNLEDLRQTVALLSRRARDLHSHLTTSDDDAS